MKRKYIFIIIFVLAFFINITNVNAAREICTRKAYSDAQMKAYNVKFSYELKFDDNHFPYFLISYTGLKEGIELRVGENSYTKSENGENGTITTVFQNTGGTYNFEFYGEYGYSCVGELLYTTPDIKLPKYNLYSEKDECIDYEEFSLCKKWYDGDIENDDYFYKKLEEYKESLKPQEEEKPEVIEEKEWYQKIIDFYMDNLIFTLPITIVIVLFIIIMVIKNRIKKKRRTKIDFDFRV